MSWTSRERVVAAIEHREPDRVPMNINPVLDFNLDLKEYLGLEIKEESRASSMAEVIPHPKVLTALGVDPIAVRLGAPKGLRPPLPDGAPVNGKLIFNEWGVGLKQVAQPGGGSYWEPIYHPLVGATIDDLEGYPWPDPAAPGRGEDAEVEAKRLYEDTDGSEQDVEQEVLRCLRAFAPGGGYILAPAHYIQADVPPANLVAMCRAARTHGRYPIRA